jgi:pimeloyl-ACP methyl ester carboxylesterase
MMPFAHALTFLLCNKCAQSPFIACEFMPPSAAWIKTRNEQRDVRAAAKHTFKINAADNIQSKKTMIAIQFYRSINMIEKTYTTPCGTIRYWTNQYHEPSKPSLIFLPGLTADHRLFDKQIAYFKNKYRVLVWDAPGHAASYPFELDFDLFDKATWLDEILTKEGIEHPVFIGQSMGGYLGQVYAEMFAEKPKGLVTIDSPPLQRKYYTAIELWLLKRIAPVFRLYSWKTLVKAVTEGVSTTAYGKKLMFDMMMTYDDNRRRFSRLIGHGFKILAKAVEKNCAYEIKCPVMVLCGKEDRIGSCIRYLKAYEKHTGKPVHWIENAGHNANTDRPETVNGLIDEFLKNLS